MPEWATALAVAAPVATVAWWAARVWVSTTSREVQVLREKFSSMSGMMSEIRIEHRDIKEDIRGHIEREETLLWPKVEDLKDRLVRIESNMPNGELKTLLYRFGQFEKRVEEVLRHVEDHNVEAEDWKRRIVVLEGKVNGVR